MPHNSWLWLFNIVINWLFLWDEIHSKYFFCSYNHNWDNPNPVVTIQPYKMAESDMLVSFDVYKTSLAKMQIISKPAWWLSHVEPTPLKQYEFVSWDDEIHNIWKNWKNQSPVPKPPTSMAKRQVVSEFKYPIVSN